MKALQTCRAIARARASAAAPPLSASLEIVVEASGGGRLDVRFNGPRDRPAKLEEEAATCQEATRPRLPDILQSGLAVEAGEIRSLLCRDDGELPIYSRSYRLASCRGIVLGLDDGNGIGGLFESPWTGTLDAAELDRALPVVLMPSAVLALVLYLLEVAGSRSAADGDAEVPGVTVLDTAASPYPPQHHPFEADGTVSPDRPLIAEGRWCDREQHAGENVDPLFFLLTRPDRALRPLAAATRFSRRNLAVACSRKASLPSPAVVIDSWRVRVGPRSGRVPFLAKLSCSGPGSERLAVTSTVPLVFDPWEILANIHGASGPAAPAIDEDPIEGDIYGAAPTLVTGVTLAALVMRER